MTRRISSSARAAPLPLRLNNHLAPLINTTPLAAITYTHHAQPQQQVINPATNKPIATMPKMKGSETLAAIAAAQSVFPAWSGMTAKQRGAILRKWVRRVSNCIRERGWD